jgi:hypothetical protein
MTTPATCPCCGVVVMPDELTYDFAGETVASLTREVAYLRETVAHLRAAVHAGATRTVPRPAPVEAIAG